MMRRFLSTTPLYWLLATLISLSICVVSLRANNEHMVKLRQAVFTADESGQGVEPALRALQAYVTAHMNTNLQSGNTAVYPPIQLKNTYDRLIVARSEKIATTNAQTYNDAQKYCEAQNSTDFSGRNRVPCIEDYVTHHGVTLPTIPDSLYKFSFISPSWSPDLAGWSMLVTIVLGIMTVLTGLVKFASHKR